MRAEDRKQNKCAAAVCLDRGEGIVTQVNITELVSIEGAGHAQAALLPATVVECSAAHKKIIHNVSE